MKVLLILLAIISLQGCAMSTPSSGKKIGHIVKVSHEGVFSPTCEGELIRGGLNDGSGSFGNIFKFTIERRDLQDIALLALKENKEVILTYHCEFISSIFRSECVNPHFVDNIEIVK